MTAMFAAVPVVAICATVAPSVSPPDGTASRNDSTTAPVVDGGTTPVHDEPLKVGSEFEHWNTVDDASDGMVAENTIGCPPASPEVSCCDPARSSPGQYASGRS